MAIRANRTMLIAGSAICAVAIVGLSFVSILYWRYPDFRDEGLPLVLFFDFVFAYRLYRYIKLMPPRKSKQMSQY
jgi:hypothetical protein